MNNSFLLKIIVKCYYKIDVVLSKKTIPEKYSGRFYNMAKITMEVLEETLKKYNIENNYDNLYLDINYQN